LTAAVAAGKGTIDTAYEIGALNNYLDILNIMTYDYHGGWDRICGANAPLYAHPSQNAQEFCVDFTVNYYIQGGFSPSKIAMGMGTYGRAMRLASANANGLGSAATGAGTAGTWTREAGFLSYYEICRALSQGWTRVYDGTTRTPYAHSGLEWVSYDDEQSLTEKCNYVKSKNLAGAMFWALDLDDFSGAYCGKGRYPLVTFVKASLAGGTFPTSGPVQPTQSPATQPPATQQPGGGFTCPSPNGLFPHPTNCHQFYSCANNVPFIQSCPDPLHFNPAGHCDWQEMAGCSGKK